MKDKDKSPEQLLLEIGQLRKELARFQAAGEAGAADSSVLDTAADYRLLVKNIPGVVYRGDADGGAQFFDDKIEALTGYPVADFASGNLKWPALIHPEDLPSAKRAFVQALRGDREYIREYRIKQRDGHY